MAENNNLILKPGMGVDLVFNLNSLSPRSRPSIIFDFNTQKKQIIVAQPTQRISLDTTYDELHISSLIRGELSSKVRMGYTCRILDILNGYQLANHGKADALLIEYSEPLKEINIRAAYRFHPNDSFDVMGKLSYNREIYYSGQHFKIQNISINGLGLLIPKKVLKTRNPLLDIQTHSMAKIGIILKYGLTDEMIETLDCDLQVVRSNSDYNDRCGFAGCAMINLSTDYEEALNKFIHNAQLHEIRKINRF
jgi:hypothetical protein